MADDAAAATRLTLKPERTEPTEDPGYWSCRRVIKDLRRFQDLVRHRDRFHNVDQAQPLLNLIPELTPLEKDPFRHQQDIETAIRHLQIQVAFYLDMAGARTRVRLPHEFNEKAKWGHIVRGYLELPVGGGQYQHVLMDAIEEGLGFYSSVRDRRLRVALNPFAWAAPLKSLLKWYATAPWQTQLALAIILLAAIAPRWVPPVADLLRAAFHGK